MIVKEFSLAFLPEGNLLNTLGLRTLDFFVRMFVFLSYSGARDSGSTRNSSTAR